MPASAYIAAQLTIPLCSAIPRTQQQRESARPEQAACVVNDGHRSAPHAQAAQRAGQTGQVAVAHHHVGADGQVAVAHRDARVCDAHAVWRGEGQWRTQGINTVLLLSNETATV